NSKTYQTKSKQHYDFKIILFYLVGSDLKGFVDSCSACAPKINSGAHAEHKMRKTYENQYTKARTR
ncbi:hypothetical protein MJI67_23585, partial [Salmonella enterica subsp. enterica serovar Cerro]|nr:hypothetical protein [Salmonella enterica subsp. enterica serovar Cerro]